MHDEVGYNYRMTNIQAALGVAQMEELPEFIRRKKSNYQLYEELLKDFSKGSRFHLGKIQTQIIGFIL